MPLQLEYDWKPEGGFVRSRIADRYLSKSALQKAVDWPSDIAMSQQLSIGDEQHWRMRFDVKSATSAGDLVRRIGKGQDSIREWTRKAGSNQWISHQEAIASRSTSPPFRGPEHWSMGWNSRFPRRRTDPIGRHVGWGLTF